MLSDTISIQLPLKYPETYHITITPEFPGPWTIKILPLPSTNLESNKNDKTTCPVLSSAVVPTCKKDLQPLNHIASSFLPPELKVNDPNDSPTEPESGSDIIKMYLSIRKCKWLTCVDEKNIPSHTKACTSDESSSLKCRSILLQAYHPLWACSTSYPQAKPDSGDLLPHVNNPSAASSSADVPYALDDGMLAQDDFAVQPHGEDLPSLEPNIHSPQALLDAVNYYTQYIFHAHTLPPDPEKCMMQHLLERMFEDVQEQQQEIVEDT
ncbi:hypothetical protein V8B97DRAFT_1915316 [Scleroderma yunnanense]